MSSSFHEHCRGRLVTDEAISAFLCVPHESTKDPVFFWDVSLPVAKRRFEEAFEETGFEVWPDQPD